MDSTVCSSSTTTPSRSFVFRRGHAAELSYGRLSTWLATTLDAAGMPHTHVDDYSEAPAGGVPVVCFDEILRHVLPAWHRLSGVMAKFVFVESEPHRNLVNCWPCMHHAIARSCAAVVTLNAGNVPWWRATLAVSNLAHIPVVFWPQGAPSPPSQATVAVVERNVHACHEQERADDDAAADKAFDIVMPGCTNSPDRVRAVESLCAAGFSVDSSTSHGPDLDRALAAARLFVYAPWGPSHRHFATQRILWAVAAGTCVVGVRSDDAEMEDLYGALYVACDTVDDLPGVCRRLIDSGDWERMGRDAATLFHQRFGGAHLLRQSAAYSVLAALVPPSMPPS